MADQPPVYNFQYNYGDYLKQAQGQLNPQYDQQVAGQQASIPLIQQQYAGLAKSLQDQQAAREGQLNQQTANQIGANRLKNAIMGLGSSSEDTAQAKTYADQNSANINQLQNALNNTLSQNNNEESQKVLSVNNMINAINQERNDKIQSLASALLGNDKSIYDQKFNTENNNYWNQQKAEADAKDYALRQAIAQADAQYRQEQLGFQQQQATINNALKASQVNNAAFSNIFYNSDGSSKNQDQVYRDLMQNGNAYRAQGVNVDALWDAWRNMAKDFYNTKNSQAAAAPNNQPRTLSSDLGSLGNTYNGNVHGLANYLGVPTSISSGLLGSGLGGLAYGPLGMALGGYGGIASELLKKK